MSKKRILLLVDGDMIAFSHAAAEEYGKEPEDVQVHKILSSIDKKMEFLSQRLGATEIITFLSGSDNMRFTIHDQYKANRDGVWRPDNLKNAKAHLQTAWNGMSMQYLEADDLIAFFTRHEYELVMGKRGRIRELIWKGGNQYDEVIIASLDKDLRQLQTQTCPTTGNRIGPKVTHYQWERESQGIGEKFVQPVGFGELKLIVKQSASGSKKKEVKGNGPKFFLWQMLTGDPTDGVMGCGIKETKVYKTGKKVGESYERRDGIGAVEAFELLDKVTSYSEGIKIVATQYLIRFADGWQREMLKNGRLLYMHHRMDDGHLVRLWHYNGKIIDRFDVKNNVIIPHDEYQTKFE